nr:hypothetical protein [Tanacetum cinerariifolium]
MSTARQGMSSMEIEQIITHRVTNAIEAIAIYEARTRVTRDSMNQVARQGAKRGKVIAYALRQLKIHEKNYITHDLKLGKGFSGVKTTLFEGMIVEQQVAEGADQVHDEGVPAAGIVSEGDVSAADDEVPTAVEEPSVSSPTPPTPSQQPSKDIPLTSQVQPNPPQSPQVQPQSPQQHPQPSQDAGIFMDLLQTLMDTWGIIKNIDADKDIVLEDAKDVEVEKSIDVEENDDIQGRTVESQAQIYQIDLEHANKVLSMQDEEESKLTKLKEVVDVLTTAKIITKVVTAASITIAAVDVPILAAATTLTAAPSRRTKGVAAKKKKLEEEVEDLKRHLQIVPNDEDDVYIEATRLARKVPVVDYEIYNQNNKPYYKIKRVDGSHQLYMSFLSLLRNFNREDLEALWRLVKEIFATTKPKNFSDDFLLIIVGTMFEKPDIHAQIWKNQRSVHGQAKVKSWKLLESCGVQIITFTTT